MPFDLTALTAAVEENEAVDAGAIVIINDIERRITEAVTAALTADRAANEESIRVANAAIATEVAKFRASSAKLSAALVANTPSAPPAEPPTT